MIIQSQNMSLVLNSDQIVGYGLFVYTFTKTDKPYRISAWSSDVDNDYLLGEYKTREEAQARLNDFAVNLAAGVRFHCFAAEDLEDEQ